MYEMHEIAHINLDHIGSNWQQIPFTMHTTLKTQSSFVKT